LADRQAGFLNLFPVFYFQVHLQEVLAMTFGDAYLVAVDQSEKWKAHLVAKLKTRNSTLNRKEIQFISIVYHIQAEGRPDNATKARIIKALIREAVPVRGRGNPGTPRDRQRDIALAVAFAAFKGTRARFYRMQQIKFVADDCTVTKALVRGEKYLTEDNNRLAVEVEEMKNTVAFYKLVDLVTAA
jgi:hypothetical protein